MRTLDEVRSRCVIIPPDDSDDGNEHWIFRGKPALRMQIQAPNYTLDPSGQTETVQSARRAVRHLATGKPIPKGWRVWSRCQVLGCVNPACVGCGNNTAYGRARSKSGVDKGRLKKVLANRRNSDLQRKVTGAVAAEIRASREGATALGERLGLHPNTVWRVLRGQSRAPGNPFQGLVP